MISVQWSHSNPAEVLKRSKKKQRYPEPFTLPIVHQNTMKTPYSDKGYSYQPLMWLKSLRQNNSHTNAKKVFILAVFRHDNQVSTSEAEK